MRFLFILICLLSTISRLFSQSAYTPLSKEYNHLIDRMEIKSGRMLPSSHTSSKPYLRKSIAEDIDSSIDSAKYSSVDRFNANYLKVDNWEWSKDSTTGDSKKPVLKHLYTKQNSGYTFNNPDFQIQLIPVANFSIGKGSGDGSTNYINTRAIEMRGSIGKKIGFYSFVSENQVLFPKYVREQNNHNPTNNLPTVPGEAFAKMFKKGNGVDFFDARGYITCRIIKQIGLQFGHDKNFFGNGYRSLSMSDQSSKYLFLKLQTNVWRFQYTNLYAQMTSQKDLTNITPNRYQPRKYLAMHHLSINIGKNLNLGIFESIMFYRNDSLNGSGGFELNYLNPVIFYRDLESYLGSQDKVLVGTDFKYNFLKHFSLYGQFIINEFSYSNLKKQNGYWANKYGWQIGLKYIDMFGIKNLDGQFENNVVRPYVYTDKTIISNYTNYSQPIAHPLGANFSEMIAILKYQPINRVTISTKAIKYIFGADQNGINYGGDITQNYTVNRPSDFGNTIGQGLKHNVTYMDFNVSWMFRHNMFLDLKAIVRNDKTATTTNNTTILGGGFRWNIGQRLNEY